MRATLPGRAGAPSAQPSGRSSRTPPDQAGPLRIQRVPGPQQGGPLGGDLAGVQRVQDPAVRGDRVPLAPGHVQADPAEHARQDLTGIAPHPGPEYRRGHLIDQSARVRAGQRDAALAQRPADHLGVAVRGPLHLPPAVVDVQPFPAQPAQRAQLGQRGIGPLQVLGPVLRAVREPGVHGPQASLLGCADLAPHRDQEVAVALQVRVADRERPLQVGAHKVGPENPRGPVGQFGDDGVQLREFRGLRRVHLAIRASGRASGRRVIGQPSGKRFPARR